MHDTHTSKLLSGTSPDITLVKKGLTLSAFNAVWVLELQVRCAQAWAQGNLLHMLGGPTRCDDAATGLVCANAASADAARR